MRPINWTPLIVPNGGIDESVSPRLLGDTKWASAFDVEPMPDGVRSRSGLTKQNAATLTNAITLIRDYWLSDGATQRHMVFAGSNLYKNVAGVMASVGSGFTSDSSRFPSAVVAQDRFLITNGYEVAKKFYILSAVEHFENEGIAPPTADITPTDIAGGTLATGVWEVDYQYWNADIAQPSNFRYQGIGAPTVTLAGSDRTIEITGLPAAVARVGDRATHIRIYLKPPSGAYFLFAGTAEGQITLGTTTATITTDELGLDPAEYDNDVPPLHKIKAVGENRQFIAGFGDFPYQIRFSKINGLSALYESFPPLNVRDFGRGDGDYVTALAYVAPSTIIVGGRNNIWAIDARHPATSDRTVIAKGVGIAGHNALAVVGRTMFFVSDADHNKGMFVWSPGAGIKPLVGIDRTFKSLNADRIKYASCATLSPGDNRMQWWTILSAAGAVVQNRALVYDFGLDAWTIYRISGSVLGEIRTNGVGRVYLGGSTGFEYLADSGTTDDGTAISPQVTLKDFDMGAVDLVKRLRFLRFLVKGEVAKAIGVSIRIDEDPSRTAQGSLQTDPPVTGGSLLGAGTLGAFVLQSTSDVDVAGRVALVGSGRAFQPTLSGATPWRLRGLAIGAQPTGRRN